MGVLLLFDAMRTRTYNEFWFEHREDILGVRGDGGIDVFQVKTRQGNGKWTTRDADMVKALVRFGQLEATWGARIHRYVICSNVAAYIPGESADDDARKSRSLVLLKSWITSLDRSNQACADELAVLVGKTGLASDVLAAVLGKLAFMVGPALESLRESVITALNGVPEVSALSVAELARLGASVQQAVEDASSYGLPGIDVFTSVMSGEGAALRLVQNKRVEVAAISARVDGYLSGRRRRSRLRQAAFVLAVGAVAGGIIWFNHKPLAQSYLEKAFGTVASARGSLLPAEFPEAVATLRSASAVLDGIDLDGAIVQCQDLSRLQMIRMSARSLHGTGVNFNGSRMTMSDLSFSELNASSFANAVLEEARFQRSNMLFANFKGASARGSDFSASTLNGATFTSAKLGAADFSGADLMLADFEDADLAGAKFQGANLAEVNLSGANLKGAKGLDQAMLDASCAAPDQPPLLDDGLQASMAPCFTSPQERETRMAKRSLMAVVGQMSVIGGYCKDGKVVVRPADGSGMPEFEMPFYLPLLPKE